MPDDVAQLKIVGLARLISTMKKAGVDMADMKDANVAAARIVAVRADELAPRRTGNLAAALRTPRAQGRARVANRLVYAGPIHWGWPKRHIRPQPFIWDAAQQTSEQWMAQYEKDLQRICNSVKGA